MKQQPDNPKKRKIISDQIKNKIKIKPMNEQINNIPYIYGLLKKKNQSFVLTNERLLMLKGIRFIGYARNIPNETFLPFASEANIPKMKVELELSRIQNVIAQNQTLTVQFIPEANQPKWEFVCDSKLVAADWKKLILDAANAMKLNNSNVPIQINLPDQQNGGGTAVQNGYRTPEKKNGGGNIGIMGNQPNFGNLSNSGNKIQLPVILQQHQDNQTEHPHNRDSFPLGRTEEIKQPPGVLSLSIKPSTDSKPLDLKEQYSRKKKEEERMKDSLVQNNNLLKQSTASNKSGKNDKKILDCNWDYEFLKGESQHIIVERFKTYIEDIVRTVIDELSLEERRRQYKPSEESLGHLKYQVGGVSLQVAFLELNEVSTFQDRSTIVSSQRVKMVQQQFKNANYILQITRNRGRFRVPLMMLSQYKGFTILAKANVHSSNQYASIQNSIQQDIAQLQRDTKVSRSLFEDEENIKVIAADQKFFEKLSRSQNKFKKFDVCFLTDINHYLPQDFFGFNRAGNNLNRLRAEILQDEEYDDLLFNGGNLNAMLSRVKVPTETRDAINLLTDVSKTIPERVATLVQQIEGLDRPITNSEELSQLLHLSGLNIRYLGIVFDNAKETWLKGILLAEIVARSAKYFLRYDLQDSTINLGASSLENAFEYQVNQVLGWLNRIFGIGNESQSLWRQIFRQAQTYFKCSVSKDILNVGFLMQALEYHGKFRLQGITLNESFFKANNIFGRHHFGGFMLTSKTYDLAFTDHYSLLNNKMQDLSFESYEQVRSILNIQKRQGLESHYFLNNSYRKIVLYLIHWLSPAEAPYLYKMNSSNAPSLYFYEVQSTAIKWELKAGRIVEAERIKDWIVQHINRWLGECHPVLAELFDIFSRFYLNYREQEKRAVSYCKNSLKNQEKLLGGHHIKLADAYYNLGEVHLHYAKKVDALNCFKRASQILTDSKATLSQPYIQIALKVSQLYLANNAIAQALQSAREAQSLSEQLKNLQQYLSAAELIGRCYEISDKWIDYIKFVTELIPLIPLYKESSVDLERLLKVVFLPIFQNIATKSRESCKALSSVLSEFQERIGANSLGYSFIKLKIQEKIFPSVFLDYLDNIQLLLRDLGSSNVLTRWRGFQNSGTGRVGRTVEFLAMLQALNCYLSGNFVEGIFAAQQ